MNVLLCPVLVRISADFISGTLLTVCQAAQTAQCFTDIFTVILEEVLTPPFHR